MKINCFRTKFTALFLSLVLIWLSVPVGSIDLTLDDSLIKEEATLQTNSSALTEDISLRDEFTKHYYDSDGNYYAVVYPEQVHYKENNEWKEVDNTLSFDSTTKKYTTNGPEFATTFANSTSSNQLVSISDGEYTLSWTVSFPNNQDTELSTMSISSTEITESSGLTISASTAQISQIETDAENEITTKETVGKVGKTISSVRYKNVFNNSVDLRYSVLHGKVEEDIILYSPEGFTSYTLTVNTGGLTAIKLPDNTIIFANEDGEGIFNLGAPWMKDSGVSVTDDITVNVVQRGNYAYITYIPNSEWLNDTSRIYPVLIDPSFTTRKYLSNYEDTYVFTGDSASATRATETTMKVGKIDSKTHYSYIKILDIPDLVKTSSLIGS